MLGEEASGRGCGEAMRRAGPVMVPQRRIDSNIAERRRDHGEGLAGEVGVKVSREEMVAVERELTILAARPGVLFMSRRVDVTVAWRLRRPIQTVITTRSVVGEMRMLISCVRYLISRTV